MWSAKPLVASGELIFGRRSARTRPGLGVFLTTGPHHPLHLSIHTSKSNSLIGTVAALHTQAYWRGTRDDGQYSSIKPPEARGTGLALNRDSAGHLRTCSTWKQEADAQFRVLNLSRWNSAAQETKMKASANQAATDHEIRGHQRRKWN